MKHASNVTLYNWDDVKNESLNELIDRKMIWGERTMLSHVYLKKGSVVPLHHHDNEQFSYILSGSMQFWLERDGGEEVFIKAGEVLHLPSNVPHGAIALEDTLSLDVFSPPRQDWIDGTDDYLRGE